MQMQKFQFGKILVFKNSQIAIKLLENYLLWGISLQSQSLLPVA